VLLFLLLAAWMAMRQKHSLPRLPNPNGYDDLTAVATMMVPNPGYARTQAVSELRAILAPNSNTLYRIRSALAKEWRVPVAFDTNYVERSVKNYVTTKSLTELLAAEGRLCELEGRTNDALRAYIDCILLGQLSGRGGLMIDELVSIACKAIGMKETRRILYSSETNVTQELLQTLTRADRSQEPAEEFLTRDRNWSINSYGWLRFASESLVNGRSYRTSREHFRERDKRSEAEVRLLRVDLALALYHRSTGHYPKSLDELVPRSLESPPLDPFSGQPLIYRLVTNSYLLYSIGPDQTDDGGKPLTKTSSEKGDILSTPPSAP